MAGTKKSLGQHWLRNRDILEQIADLAVPAGVDPHDLICIEIGPGLGTLTSSLLRRFRQVIAIEFDAEQARKLPASFPGKNLQVIHADILAVDIAKLVPASQPYSVAGNIPYYITSPIIHQLLATRPLPDQISLLIQKEVAERLLATPGDYSYFSLEVQNLAKVSRGPLVPAVEFTPPPKVDSEVIALTPLAAPQISPSALSLARIGFSAPRKKVIANLAAGTQLSREAWQTAFSDLSLNLDARAEDLSLADWQNLSSVL